MADKPIWKGTLVNRDWLKERLEHGFMRMASGDYDVELARMANEIEMYLAGKVVSYSREMVEGVLEALQSSMGTLEEVEQAIARDQIKSLAKSKKREAEEEAEEEEDE